MSSYISRVFARPHLPQVDASSTPSDDRETVLNLDLPQHERLEPRPPPVPAYTQTSTSQTPNAIPSNGQASIPQSADKPSEDQFQIMFSSILAQNSNLLAQNTEQARVIDRLSICLKEAEAGQKELREEMRGMFRSIMDILGTLKASPGVGQSGGATTPTSAAAGSSTSGIGTRSAGAVNGDAGDMDFRELVDTHTGKEGNVGGSLQREFWSRDKGKGREMINDQGVNPNVLKRAFTVSDTPTDRGNNDEGSVQGMDNVWNDNVDIEGNPLSSLSRQRGRSSTIEGMSATRLSAIAQQVVDMQNQEDEVGARIRDDITSQSPVLPTNQEEDPITPTRSASGRPIRQSASRGRNISSLLPDEEIATRVKKPDPNLNTKERQKSDRKRALKSKKEKVKVQYKAKRQRTFNGRVSMTARPLGRGDGRKRGEGIWPEKGQNTVKGNMCNGRVHWACAGFQDDSVPPDEWECPDCEDKVAKGESPTSIERSPQTHCVRPTCIAREKKKIVMKEGDSEEFYVEKYIGRRAVGRRPDGTSRIFEYLVKWLGWPRDTSTWEHERKWPTNNHFADGFLAECEIYEVNTKKRVALLPEARRWFDDEGDVIETAVDYAEEDFDDTAGPSGTGLEHRDEKEDDEDQGSDEE